MNCWIHQYTNIGNVLDIPIITSTPLGIGRRVTTGSGEPPLILTGRKTGNTTDLWGWVISVICYVFSYPIIWYYLGITTLWTRLAEKKSNFAEWSLETPSNEQCHSCWWMIFFRGYTIHKILGLCPILIRYIRSPIYTVQYIRSNTLW